MSDGAEPLARLRAAAARVDDLGGWATPSPAPDSFDPVEHAARFDDLHDALVAVLADIESGETPGRI